MTLNVKHMDTFTLLSAEFYLRLEARNEAEIKSHYEEMRQLVVKFAHGNLSWRDIHTGLTIFISEVSALIEENLPLPLERYAKRILAIAKGLMAQLEYIGTHHNPKVKHMPTKEEEPVTLTAQYSNVAEIINLIIAMKMLNGGNISNETIINRVHRMFGIDKTPADYYNARKGLKKRCPKDDENFAYFIAAGLKVLNAELAA